MNPYASIFSRAAFALMLAIPVSASAVIDMLPKEATVEQKSEPITLVNNGDHAEYVTISLSRLLNPGVPLDEERLEPVGDETKPSLYVYPFRVSLAAGQTKIITLKPLRAVDTETVYRLDVQPVIKLLGSERRNTSANVVVSLGFSGLVRQLPPKVREGLDVVCDASGARLTATGTVRYRVEGAQADGHAIDAFNVYPGMPLPLTGRVVEIPGHPACRATVEK
ncbi:hypothetical protein [Burkholderia sp. BCC0397]|uniref:hypothetical protein n=1 Tax=Burkholderia sp. BCC0397 TaxID=486876 RepID=UPI0015884A69|nr:hypothetical protein [Burkholderia sp. BCC0397]